MKLFEVFGVIDIDGEKGNKEMDKSEKKGKKLSKAFGKVGVGIAAGIAVGTAAMVKLTSEAAEATDRIDKMSTKIGISREAFQEWDFIASQSGTSMEAIQTGMKKLTVSVSDLASGTGAGAEAFEKLGITMEDLHGKSQEEIFETTIKALQEMPESAEKSAIALDLLGRGGQELAPILNTTEEAIVGMKTQAHELGLVLEDDAIDAGVNFTDAMDQMKRMMATVVTEVGVQLMPIMMEMSKWFMDNLPTIKKVFSITFDVIKKAIEILITVVKDYLMPIFKIVYQWIMDNLPAIQKTFEVVFDVIKTVIGVIITIIRDVLMPIFKAVYQWVVDNLPAIRAVFEAAFSLIGKYIEAVVYIWQEVFWPILKKVFNWINDNMPLIQTIFEVVFTAIGVYIDVFINIIKAAIKTLDWFMDKVFGFIDGVKEAIGAVKEFLTLGGNTEVSAEIVDKRTKRNVNTGGRRALGGNVTKGASYLVGENGAEKFVAPSNGKIIPNGGDKQQVLIKIDMSNSLVTDDVADTLGEVLVNALERKGVLI